MKKIANIILFFLLPILSNAQTLQERQDEYNKNFKVGTALVGSLSIGTTKSVTVTFPTPFDVGVTPVVTINAINESLGLLDSFSITISSISNTGFTAIVQKTVVGIWLQNLKINYYAHR